MPALGTYLVLTESASLLEFLSSCCCSCTSFLLRRPVDCFAGGLANGFVVDFDGALSLPGRLMMGGEISSRCSLSCSSGEDDGILRLFFFEGTLWLEECCFIVAFFGARGILDT